MKPNRLATLLALALLACGGEKPPETVNPDAFEAVEENTPVNPVQDSNNAAPAAVKVAADTGSIAQPEQLVRETFAYSFTRSSRDPFQGLAVATTQGPELMDLRLISVIYNHTDPRMSLATFEDVGNKKQYYVRPGDRIGRLVVSTVELDNATLRVNEYGTIRQQTYSLTRGEDGNQ